MAGDLPKDIAPIPFELESEEDRKTALKAMRQFREALQTLLNRRGYSENRAVLWRDLVDAGYVDENGDLAPTGSGAAGPPGPTGPPGAPAPGTTPDLTPPPDVTGLSAVAGFSNVIIQWTGVAYAQGHGNKYTHIYAVKKAASDPTLPVFADAVEVAQATGVLTIIALPSDLATRWHIWAKFETNDGEFSVNPAGGTNGVTAQTGKVGEADLSDLVITAQKLAEGAVDLTTNKVKAAANFGAIAVGYTVTQYLLATSGVMQNLVVDDAQIVNLAASKILSGSIGVGQYIQSTGYVAGSAGWRINGDGTAEFSAAGIRGQLVAAQIDSRGLDIKDSLGNVILSAGATPGMSWAYLGDQPGPNLIINPELDYCSSGDTDVPGWVRSVAGSVPQADIFKATSNPSYGPPWNKNAAVFQSQVDSPSEYVRWYHADTIPIDPNENYTLAAWVKQFDATEVRVYLGLICYDNAGNNLGNAHAISFGTISQNWERRVGVYGPGGIAFPAGTAAVRPQWYGAYNTAGTNYTGQSMATRFTFNQGRTPVNSYAPFNPFVISKINPITGSNVTTFIGSAAISDAQIGSLAANKIIAGALGVGRYIQSTNYSAGAAGWRINADGTAEFRNVTVRGDVQATSVSGASGTFGTITAGLLRNAANTTQVNLNATGSQDFIRAGNGAVRITADGDAFFTAVLDSGTWTGSLQLIDVETVPTLQYLTPVKTLLIDTGFNIPIQDFYDRTLAARVGVMSATYAPSESSGQRVGIIEINARPIVRVPFFAAGVEGSGQNPYGTGNQRVFIEVSVRLADRENKTSFAMTSIAWTLDAVG